MLFRTVQSFAGGDRDIDMLRHQTHSVEIFRQNWVFVEVGIVLLDAAAQSDRLCWGEAAVNLDTKVNVVAHGVSVRADGVDGVADLVGVGLEVRNVARLVKERRQMADGGESKLFGVLDALDQPLDRQSVL